MKMIKAIASGFWWFGLRMFIVLGWCFKEMTRPLSDDERKEMEALMNGRMKL